MTLCGYIDIATTVEVAGWAHDTERPNLRVSLIVTLDDELLGRVLADNYRPDLEAAGYGDGRGGFALTFDAPLTMMKRGVLRVRRESDGWDIPSSPRDWTPPSRFDAEIERMLGQALDRYGSDEDLERRIDFLVGKTAQLLHEQGKRDGRRELRRRARDYHRRWGRPVSSADEAQAAAGSRPLRALLIDETPPRADRDAGSASLLSHAASLRRLGFQIGFAAFATFGQGIERDATADLDALGVESFGPPYYASVEDVMIRQAGEFDVVYLGGVSAADRYLALARAHFPKARILFSLGDLPHLRVARQAAAENRPELTRVAEATWRREALAIARADAVLTRSAVEAAFIGPMLGAARCHVVPWSRPQMPVSKPFQRRRGLALLGAYGHEPDLDAAVRLIREIMPRVRAVDPTIECLLVGEGLPANVRDLCGDGCVAVGRVASLSEIFDRVRLTVAPLAYGAGLKGEVLDSLAAGVPCVCTPIAAEGLELPKVLRRLVADDAAGLAAAILRLHADADDNAQCARAGLQLVATHFSDEVVDARLRAAVGGFV